MIKGIEKTELAESAYLTNKIYDEADIEVDVSRYNDLRDIPEVIKEIVPYTKLKKSRTDIEIFNPNLRKVYPDNPLILINGEPACINGLLQLQPSEIFKIDVLYERSKIWKVGSVALNGILAVYTYPLYDRPETCLTTLSGNYQGLQRMIQNDQDFMSFRSSNSDF